MDNDRTPLRSQASGHASRQPACTLVLEIRIKANRDAVLDAHEQSYEVVSFARYIANQSMAMRACSGSFSGLMIPAHHRGAENFALINPQTRLLRTMLLLKTSQRP